MAGSQENDIYGQGSVHFIVIMGTYCDTRVEYKLYHGHSWIRVLMTFGWHRNSEFEKEVVDSLTKNDITASNGAWKKQFWEWFRLLVIMNLKAYDSIRVLMIVFMFKYSCINVCCIGPCRSNSLMRIFLI